MSKKSKLKKLAARLGRLEQVAALPYRMGEQGIEFLVITSRRTKRLIVPKGWPMPGKHDAAAAAIEADEEAGVKGHIDQRPFGSFEYFKQVGSIPIPVHACVFPLHVKKVKSTWKECKQRKRKWLAAEDAAARLDDDGLRRLVRRYADRVTGTGGASTQRLPISPDAPSNHAAKVFMDP